MTYPGVILKAWNLHAKKQLGQNFLSNPEIAEMLVRRAGVSPKDIVVEIGAGLGAMTIPLSRIAQKVYAIEKDRQLIPLLNAEIITNEIDQEKIKIINDNFLKTDICELTGKDAKDLVIIGNLPYNISSQILMSLIPQRRAIKKAVFMFQKELAERIVAKPGIKDYGRLSVAMQYCSSVKKIADVKSHLFFPKPKVDSVVIEITFFKKIDFEVNDETFFFSVIKAAFGNRRKTLRNSLAGSALDIDGETAKKELENIDIDPTRRAETLTVKEFVKLSNRLGIILNR